MDWIGKEFELGTAIVRGMKRTQRCAATNVNPKTAQRDLNVPKMLFENYNHSDLGIYLEVVKDGQIAVNDNFYVPNN